DTADSGRLTQRGRSYFRKLLPRLSTQPCNSGEVHSIMDALRVPSKDLLVMLPLPCRVSLVPNVRFDEFPNFIRKKPLHFGFQIAVAVVRPLQKLGNSCALNSGILD